MVRVVSREKGNVISVVEVWSNSSGLFIVREGKRIKHYVTSEELGKGVFFSLKEPP